MALGDFFVDPDFKIPGTKPPKGGGPPPGMGHPRQCQAKSSFHHEQCRKWALRGAIYCGTHNKGRKGKKTGHQTRKVMANRYTRAVAGRLGTLLNSVAEDDKEKIDLEDEIDVMRTLCSQALGILSSVAAKKEEGDKRVSDKTVIASMHFAEGCLMKIGTLVEKQAKVAALGNSSFDKGQMDYIITRVCALLQRFLLPEYETLFEQICTAIGDISPPEKAGANVSITI